VVICSYFHRIVRSIVVVVVVVVVVMIKKYDEGIGQDNLKIQRSYNRTAECKNKSETSNNRSSWNHLQMIQKICEQSTWKA
jgi:hypothetical protein